MEQAGIVVVGLAALATALATGLGALPLAFARRIGPRWQALSAALAGGLMLAASHALIAEGNTLDTVRTVVGMLIGVAVVTLGQRLVRDHDEMSVGDLRGADAAKALLIVGVMTVHSFAEGIGVGVAFGGEQGLGLYITLAIAVHNIPEGLAISLVMVPRGTTVGGAAAWCVLSSLPQPLMAIPAFLSVTTFQPVLPVGLGLAAGAMVWMVLAELLPDALEHVSATSVAVTATIALALMIAFQSLVLAST